MLADAAVATRIPCADLERARAFYRDKLGLEPSEARPGAAPRRAGSQSHLGRRADPV
jgi:catechol 2,3-dioxygenase-like lactoylglutathione lyase family enzyme